MSAGQGELEDQAVTTSGGRVSRRLRRDARADPMDEPTEPMRQDLPPARGDQLARQAQTRQQISQQYDIPGEDVRFQPGGGLAPETRRDVARVQTARAAGPDFTREDITAESRAGEVTTSVREDAQRRELREDVAEAAGPDYTTADVTTEREDDKFVGRVTEEARRRELREDVAEEAGPDYTTADISTRFVEGRLTGRVSREAREREATEDLLEQVGDDFTRSDVETSETDQGVVQASISRGALAREATADFLAENPEFTESDVVTSETEEGGVQVGPSEDAQRREFREEAAAEFGEEVQPADVDVTRTEGGEFQASLGPSVTEDPERLFEFRLDQELDQEGKRNIIEQGEDFVTAQVTTSEGTELVSVATSEEGRRAAAAAEIEEETGVPLRPSAIELEDGQARVGDFSLTRVAFDIEQEETGVVDQSRLAGGRGESFVTVGTDLDPDEEGFERTETFTRRGIEARLAGEFEEYNQELQEAREERIAEQEQELREDVVRQEFRQRAARALDPGTEGDLMPEDIELQTIEGQLVGSATGAGRVTEAGMNFNVTESDVETQREDGQLIGRLPGESPEDQRESLREELASRSPVLDTSDISVRREAGRLIAAPATAADAFRAEFAARQELREKVAAQSPEVSTLDVRIQESGGELIGRATVSPERGVVDRVQRDRLRRPTAGPEPAFVLETQRQTRAFDEFLAEARDTGGAFEREPVVLDARNPALERFDQAAGRVRERIPGRLDIARSEPARATITRVGGQQTTPATTRDLNIPAGRQVVGATGPFGVPETQSTIDAARAATAPGRAVPEPSQRVESGQPVIPSIGESAGAFAREFREDPVSTAVDVSEAAREDRRGIVRGINERSPFSFEPDPGVRRRESEQRQREFFEDTIGLGELPSEEDVSQGARTVARNVIDPNRGVSRITRELDILSGPGLPPIGPSAISGISRLVGRSGAATASELAGGGGAGAISGGGASAAGGGAVATGTSRISNILRFGAAAGAGAVAVQRSEIEVPERAPGREDFAEITRPERAPSRQDRAELDAEDPAQADSELEPDAATQATSEFDVPESPPGQRAGEISIEDIVVAGARPIGSQRERRREREEQDQDLPTPPTGRPGFDPSIRRRPRDVQQEQAEIRRQRERLAEGTERVSLGYRQAETELGERFISDEQRARIERNFETGASAVIGREVEREVPDTTVEQTPQQQQQGQLAGQAQSGIEPIGPFESPVIGTEPEGRSGLIDEPDTRQPSDVDLQELSRIQSRPGVVVDPASRSLSRTATRSEVRSIADSRGLLDLRERQAVDQPTPERFDQPPRPALPSVPGTVEPSDERTVTETVQEETRTPPTVTEFYALDPPPGGRGIGIDLFADEGDELQTGAGEAAAPLVQELFSPIEGIDDTEDEEFLVIDENNDEDGTSNERRGVGDDLITGFLGGQE